MIAAIADGVEVFHHGGGDQYAGAGALALVNPDTRTPGGPGAGGLAVRRGVPVAQVVAAIAAETTTLRGTRASCGRCSTIRTPSAWCTRYCGPPTRATRSPPTPCCGRP
ncbi:hypothetical protein ACR6C2_33710 [Streptomyces sp. INA 01156]